MDKPMRPGKYGGKLKTGGVHAKGGRPKMPDLREAVAAVLADEKDGVTALDAVLKKLRQLAVQGNLKAADMLLDRAYGKPAQTLNTTDEDGNTVPLRVIIQAPPPNLATDD
jgi:hypothetical protein